MEMNTRLSALIVAGLSALALVGCTGESSEADAETVAGAGAVEESAEPIVTEEPLSPGEDLIIECHDAESEVFTNFASPEEAWKAPRENRASCGSSFKSQGDLWDDSFFENYILTDTEEAAIETAKYEDESSIGTLYSICAESDLGDVEQSLPWSSGQIAERKGALVLCPDHPDREAVEERMEKGLEEEEARSRGEIFNDGTYKVGEDLQAGTYVTESEEPFDGCYWERLDSSGEIIENNFVNSGFRVQVTISSSDYSFSAERCGQWRKK